MQNWVRELKRVVGTDICLIIAGNKCDMKSRQLIPEEEVCGYVCLFLDLG
jgi:GTPase SAR1 family protein